MTMTSCEEAAFGTTAEVPPQYLAVACGTAALYVEANVVQRWRRHSSIRANLGEKVELSGL